jgi:CrcB protein
MNDAALWSAVAAGGALGALVRGGVYRWGAAPLSHIEGPLGLGRATLTVNLAGSFLLGVLVELLTGIPANDPLRIFWLTGFCGSLTTFSTFCADAIRLTAAQGRGPLLRYLLANGVLSLVGFSAGLSVAS